MKNFTLPTFLLLSVFPTGSYKYMEYYTLGNGTSVFNNTGIAELKSSNRDTFG